MKYYSDKTKKLYGKIDELKTAEKEYDEAHAAELKEKEEAKKDAEAIKAVYDEITELQKKYRKMVSEYTEKHHSYHLTITSDDYFQTIFDRLFNF